MKSCLGENTLNTQIWKGKKKMRDVEKKLAERASKAQKEILATCKKHNVFIHLWEIADEGAKSDCRMSNIEVVVLADGYDKDGKYILADETIRKNETVLKKA